MYELALAWFLATAYCQSGETRSGVHTQPGVIAADPRVLPVGSRVRVVDRGQSRPYTVLDTGRAIRGRKIDVFVPNCARAKRFGERRVDVRIVKKAVRRSTASK